MLTLSFETDLGHAPPFWFRATDSKDLCLHIIEHKWEPGVEPDVLGQLRDRFGLDLTPLLKVGTQVPDDLTLEEWLEEGWGEDEKEWRETMAINREAWQPPEALIGCLTALLQALDREPDVFETLGVEVSYFRDGFFRQDLEDLLRMARWAQEAGAKKVRLVMA